MKNLKLLRENMRISQQKLGEHIGVTQQAIHKYETNVSEPDIQTLISLANFFGTSVDYLIGNTGNPRKYSPEDTCQENSEEELHMEKYRRLPPSVRILIDGYMQEYLDK